MGELHHAQDESWDKKKIIIFLSVLLAVLGIAYYTKSLVLGDVIKKISSTSKTSQKQVEGITINKSEGDFKASEEEKKSSDLVKTALQEKLEDIRGEVANLDLEEIATSSPQIQKIVNDLKALEQVPRNQAKDLCVKMCSSL